MFYLYSFSINVYKMLIQTPKKANQISLELVHILETSACPLSKLPRGEKGKTPWPCHRLQHDYFNTVRDPLPPPGPCVPASSHSQLGDSGGHPAGRVMGHPPMAPRLSPPLGSPGITPPTPPKGEAAWSRPLPGSPAVPRRAAALTRSPTCTRAAWPGRA